MTPANCPTRDRISRLCQGLLDADEESQVTDHLEACQECSAIAAECDVEQDSLVALLHTPHAVTESADDDRYQAVQARVKRFDFEPGPSHSDSHRGRLPLTQLRDYRLIRKLGEGGMGTVYQALHTRLDRVVALKVLPPERTRNAQAIARFQQEMRAIGSLDHPSIVRATDAGDVDATHFLVMEYVEGLDLARLSRRSGQLPVAEACEIVRQAAVGLQHVHERGMVHRDIKPSNLMLNPEGQVKVLDLGLALLQHQTGDAHELTTLGQFLGTLDYMSPEQADDSHDVDRRTDIYGLGATLYRMLAGLAPYAGRKFDSPIKKIKGLALTPVPPIREHRPEIPEPLAQLIERMLSKQPDDRPASLDEIIAELAPFADGADLVGLLANADKIEDHSEPRSDQNEPGDLPRSAGHAAAPVEGGSGHGAGWFRRWWALAAFGFLSLLAAGVAIYIETDTGELIIRSDEDVEVLVKKSGKVIDDWELSQGDNRTTLRSGSYEIVLIGNTDGLKVTKDQFELTRDGEHVATIERVTTPSRRTESADALPVDERLIYDGKSFQEWAHVLKTDRSPDVVIEAIQALSALADDETSAKAVPLILSETARYGDPWSYGGSPDGDVRHIAIIALQRIGRYSKGLKALANALETGSGNDRIYCLYALSRLNFVMRAGGKEPIANSDPIPIETAQSAVPAIVAASHDDNARVRMFAIQVATGIDIENKRLNARAAELLEDDNLEMVHAAATTILDAAAKKSDAERSLPAEIGSALTRVVDAQDDQLSPQQRFAPIDKLCEISLDHAALPQLLIALIEQKDWKQTDWNLRGAALDRLAELGPRARPAIPVLTMLLKIEKSYNVEWPNNWRLTGGSSFGQYASEYVEDTRTRPKKRTIALLVLDTLEAIGPPVSDAELIAVLKQMKDDATKLTGITLEFPTSRSEALKTIRERVASIERLLETAEEPDK